MRLLTFLSVVVLGGLSGGVYGQSSKDYAMMAKAAWTAFECSALASVTGDAKEQERLFKFGYERGTRFIKAFASGKVEQQHIYDTVPSGFSMLLQGPNADFILGMVYSDAQRNALEKVFADDGKLHSKELQKIIADNRYHQRSCALIGTR